MNQTINEISALLSKLESELAQAERTNEFRALSGLELPDIIGDIVDLLMPELKPYEVALYVYFLRHSIVSEGSPYFRASRRGLQSGVLCTDCFFRKRLRFVASEELNHLGQSALALMSEKLIFIMFVKID